MAWNVEPSSGDGRGDIVRISNDEENLARGSRGCSVVFTNEESESAEVTVTQDGQRVNRGVDVSSILFTEEAGADARSFLSNASRMKIAWDDSISSRVRSLAVQFGTSGFSVLSGGIFDLVDSDSDPAETVTITVYSTASTTPVSGSIRIYDCTGSDDGTLVFTIPVSTDISGELRVDPERLDFASGQAAGQQTFRVYSNLPWTLQQQGSSGFSCMPSLGGGSPSGEAVQVTKMGANDTRTAKTATVTVSNGEETAQVLLSQAGELVAEAVNLSAISLNAAGRNFTKSVRTNAEKVTVRLKSGTLGGRLTSCTLVVAGTPAPAGDALPQTADVCSPTESPKTVEFTLDFKAGYSGASGVIEAVALVGEAETVIGEVQVSEAGILASPLSVGLPAAGTEQTVTVDSASAWTAEVQTGQ